LIIFDEIKNIKKISRGFGFWVWDIIFLSFYFYCKKCQNDAEYSQENITFLIANFILTNKLFF